MYVDFVPKMSDNSMHLKTVFFIFLLCWTGCFSAKQTAANNTAANNTVSSNTASSNTASSNTTVSKTAASQTAASKTAANKTATLQTATRDDIEKLLEQLKNSTTATAIPIDQEFGVVKVEFSSTFSSLIRVDEHLNYVTVDLGIKLSWRDTLLQWTPDDFGGIESIFLSKNDLWTPEAYQQHSPVSLGVISNHPTEYEVDYEGEATAQSWGPFTTSCKLDMTHFPYDQQTCSFHFSLLKCPMSFVQLSSQSSIMFENTDEEWEILTTFQEKTGGKSAENGTVKAETIIVYVTFQRQPSYFLLSVYVPASLVCFLMIPGFAVPVDGRLGYTLTVMLSLTVYVSGESTQMPSSSANLPLVLLYLFMLFVMSTLSVLVTVILITLRESHVYHDADGNKFITILCFRHYLNRGSQGNSSSGKDRKLMFGRFSKTAPLTLSDIDNSDGSNSVFSGKDPLSVDFAQTIKGVTFKRGGSKESDPNAIDPDLESLLKYLDKFCLYFFFISFSIVTTVMYTLIYFQI